MSKKILCVVLCILMCMSLLPAGALAAEELPVEELPIEEIPTEEIPEEEVPAEEALSEAETPVEETPIEEAPLEEEPLEEALEETDDQILTAQVPVSYLTYDSKTGAVLPNRVQATGITSATEVIGDGWYVVDQSIEHNGLRVKGNANLILMNDCTLTVKGIDVPAGSSLTIYAQSSKISEMGTLKANGLSHAGIGSGDNTDAGSITINGGKIEATGGWLAAGIGGGNEANGGNVKISGNCSVYAKTDSADHAIGSGAWGSSEGTFTVANGFTITNNYTGKTALIPEFILDKEVSITVEFVPVPYLEPGITEPINCIDYRYVDSYDNMTLTTGWYVITGGTTNNPITVNGQASLILQDGCTLNANKGISVSSGSSLTIYAQSTDESKMGHLIAAGEENCAGISGTVTINGGYIEATGGTNGAGISGTVTINGGKIEATGGTNCAGISGTVNINGGKIEATGGRLAAGIGGGQGGNGGTVTINGGEVVANGGLNGAGIGGGSYGNGGTVTISGGEVEANGEQYGAGIGGGSHGAGGKFTISGGKVEANGGENGAGIGGGFDGAGGTVTVNGGTVVANSKEHAANSQCAAGIGGGSSAKGGTVIINDGYVEANGGRYSAGIGGGYEANGGTVTVNGGYVEANGGEYGAGIGGGERGNGSGEGGTFAINGGEVVASGGTNGAGIGGGEHGNGGTVTINGGEVTATGGSYAAGIGGGYEANGATIRITGPGTVKAEAGSGTPNAIGNGQNGSNPGEFVIDSGITVINNKTGNIKTSSKSYETDWFDFLKGTSVDFTTTAKKEKLSYYITDSERTDQTGTVMTDNAIVWIDPWYVVSDECAIPSVTVSGNVNLILEDGCRLTVNNGIRIEEGSRLTVYAQSTDFATMGKLYATSSTDSYAGIGSGPNKASGNITIYGGYIEARGGKQAAGIGGGSGRNGIVTINAGEVEAYGGQGGAGIGGGYNGECTVTINGGHVVATGGENGAGIGSGSGRNGTVTINDGKIEAYGGQGGGAGIGGGYNAAGTVKIYGGDVEAYGGQGGGAGIGGGSGSSGSCNVFIDGKTIVNAKGGLDETNTNPVGPGIGCGAKNTNSVVEFRDGNIHAEGAEAIKASRIRLNAYEDYYMKVTTDNGATFKYYLAISQVEFSGKTEAYLEPIKNSERPIGKDDIPFMAYKDGQFEKAYCNAYTYRTTGSFNSEETLTTGWYVLDGGTASERITISGDVKIILLNGADCYFRCGIGLHSGSKLSIYAQPAEEGKSVGQLRTSGNASTTYYNDGHTGGAGIGGDFYPGFENKRDATCGDVYIYGGKLDIKGDEFAAGIGGAGDDYSNSYHVGNGGNVYIYGGDVTATGGECAAGIGGGAADEKAGNGGNTYVYGGIVHAYGGDAAAGIGGGTMIDDNVFRSNEGTGGSGGNFVMYGGEVYAYGGNTSSFSSKDVGGGAGIGGGLYGVGGSVTVCGGTLEAIGAEDATGIGGGGWSAGGTFTLNGGKVIAKGGNYGAAIGGGREAKGSNVYLNGGELDATYGYETFAIGGGDNINDEGNVYVGDDLYVFDCRGMYIINPDAGKRDWNDIFHGKDYVHVKLVSSENFDMLIPADYLAYKEATKDFELTTNNETIPVVNKIMTLTTWNAGWYVLDSDAAVNEPIKVNGKVNLILKDGCTLNASKGVRVPAGSSLTIYGQSTDEGTMGSLIATGEENCAGIGGGAGSTGGTVTINGGHVVATGGGNGAGIGGTFTLNGGYVEATGGRLAAGIGGGQGGNGGIVTINGGKVEANGGLNGAGIGGGDYGTGATVTINGGKVTATGYDYGAGIGGGSHGAGGKFTITDGEVYAYGGYDAAGIGGGNEANGGTVTINGGYIEANGGSSGAGIGGGDRGTGGTVTVNGGEVEANGGVDAAGIGGGYYGNGGTVTINGGYIEANGGLYGAGIGSGERGNGGNVKLSGGEVTATGGDAAAGIGGGYEANGAIVEITGPCTVIAAAGKGVSNAIGNGQNGTEPGTLEVNSGLTVTDNKTENFKTSSKAYKTDWLAFLSGASVDFTVTPKKVTTSYYVTNGERTDQTGTVMADNAIVWSEAWYVVSGECTIPSVTVSGNVNLILEDGCKLTVNDGILVEEGSSLKIYAQSTKYETKGKLYATGSDYYAGIGSGPNKASGNITIYGGYINATGGKQAAGIGGGSGRNGTVTIYGGTVYGYGGDAKDPDSDRTNFGGGAGIGGGYNGEGTVTIYGGSVYGYGGTDGAAGIGGGCGKKGTVTVYGGSAEGHGGNAQPKNVRTIPKGGGAGIGGGYNGAGVVKLYGGSVYGYGGVGGAAGVGGGCGSSGSCDVLIDNNAYVLAYGGTSYVSSNMYQPGTAATKINGGSGVGVGDTCTTGTVEIRYARGHAFGGENHNGTSAEAGDGIKAKQVIANPIAGYIIQVSTDDETTFKDYPTKTTLTDLAGKSSVHILMSVKTSQMEEEDNPTDPTNPTKPTDPDKPNTGDTSLMGLWITVMLVSAMGFAVCVTKKKRVK